HELNNFTGANRCDEDEGIDETKDFWARAGPRDSRRGKSLPDTRLSTLTSHKIPMTTFCRICDKRMSWAFRVSDRRSLPVVVTKRHSSAMACHVRLKLQRNLRAM